MSMPSRVEEKSCISKVDRKFGRFSYQINDFSSLSTVVGCAAEGPDFELCGYSWQLRLFPGGSLVQHQGYLSLYLASKSCRDCRASYKLSIVNQLYPGENRSYSSNGWRLFKARADQVDGWGRDKFIRLSELLNISAGLWSNDSIVLEVEILVYGNLEHAPVQSLASRSVHPHSLESAMGRMLNDVETADLVLLISSNQYPLYAHRFVLAARSRVFRAMLTSSMKEMQNATIVLEDLEPEVVVQLLNFLYTDTIPSRENLDNFGPQLLVAALKYEITLLADHCERYLSKRIDGDNALEVFQFADAIGSAPLRNHSLRCIAHNAASILQSKEFQELDSSLVQEVISSIEQLGSQRLCTPTIAITTEVDGTKSFQVNRSNSSNCVIM